jgi:hypothetical protein
VLIEFRRNEGDVLAAGTFNAATDDYALAVGEQYDLEQHGLG